MRELTFADAVKILDTEDAAFVKAFDRALGTGILLSAAVGFPQALALLGAKNELSKLCGRLVSAALRRASGASRRSRTEQIEAAHVVIVVTAFFEALADVESIHLNLSRKDQLEILSDVNDATPPDATFVDKLLHSGAPLLGPHLQQGDVEVEVARYFQRVLDSLEEFVAGTAGWGQIPRSGRMHFHQDVAGVPDSATSKYFALLAKLSSTYPEVEYWIHRRDQRSLQHGLERNAFALEKLQLDLMSLRVATESSVWRNGLALSYAAALERGIIDSEEAPDTVVIPALSRMYINPNYKVAAASKGHSPADEAWWAGFSVRHDVENFLLGFLTSTLGSRVPLLILGHPGSGKSVLTKVLSARLPAPDFLVIRVPLRDVSAESDIQSQIEAGVKLSTGDDVQWTRLVGDSHGALPIVLLDGFDELLQATQVRHSDYLQRVAQFQQRESEMGRPLVVVVTSRISVSDRADAPPGTLVLRLEPFSSEQTRTWIDKWNSFNSTKLRERGLLPLDPDKILEHEDLACQPLLLLMLALFDADGNGLQGLGESFGRSTLYEELLQRFASRETRRERATGRASRSSAVEDELEMLSVVAFAMFNRGRQWVSEDDLSSDIFGLKNSRTQDVRQGGSHHRAALGEAESTFGRFFFIQESKAIQSGRQLETYEFLHATFSEYLVARKTRKMLLATVARVTSGNDRDLGEHVVTDSQMRAFLSFAAISARTSTLNFLREVLSGNDEYADSIVGVIFDLLRDVAYEQDSILKGRYEPRVLSVLRRYAVYSANLLILAVVIGQSVELTRFVTESDVDDWWQQYTSVWAGQLDEEEYRNLVQLVEVSESFPSGRPRIDLTLRYDTALERPGTFRRVDIYRGQPEAPGMITVLHSPSDSEWARARARFERHPVQLRREHAVEPIFERAPLMLSTFRTETKGQVQSAANALLSLWRCIFTDTEVDETSAAYYDCMSFIGVEDYPAYDVSNDVASFMILDEKLRPEFALELLERIVGGGTCSPAVLRALGAFLGRDYAVDEKLVTLIRRTITDQSITDQSVPFPPEIALEVWLKLAENDLFVYFDGDVGRSPQALFANVEFDLIDLSRPDQGRRLRRFTPRERGER